MRRTALSNIMRTLGSSWKMALPLLGMLASAATVMQSEAFVMPMPSTCSSKQLLRSCGDVPNFHYQPHRSLTEIHSNGGDTSETRSEELPTSDASTPSSSFSSSSSRRRKRKKTQVSDGGDESEEVGYAPPPPNPIVLGLTPREDAPVQLQVKNVQDLVSGSAGSSTASAKDGFKKMLASRSVVPSSTTAGSSATSLSNAPSASTKRNDSLEQLLEDARRMKEEEGARSGGSEASMLDGLESGEGLKSTVRNVLSTIVTADFFVVCAFLLWFLAGIFVRAVFKDDTVQIAFNNNFETLVQPALGVLMVAAVAGSFLQEEDDQDNRMA